mgnify:CR=1 FL=1
MSAYQLLSQLSYNKLTTLVPLPFESLQHLRVLDVSNNRIAQLGGVHRARALQTLLLENNDLRHIPPELALLEQVCVSAALGTIGQCETISFYVPHS